MNQQKKNEIQHQANLDGGSGLLDTINRAFITAGIVTTGWLSSGMVPPALCDVPALDITAFHAQQLSKSEDETAMISFTAPVGGETPPGVDFTCLVKNCGKELIKSLMDPRGAAEIFWLSTCAADDTKCQLKAINMFEDPNVLKDFQACILGRNRCLPQRNDLGQNWVPAPSQLVSNFEIQAYSGQWYVTYGMNPDLDCFPCQRHHWALDNEGNLKVNLEYKVQSLNKRKLFPRHMSETFTQTPRFQGVLQASDETDLHQGDDWYILGGDPKEFMIVYYIGCNDSWCGYNGGNIYSRTPHLSPKARKEVLETTANIGLDFSSMCPVPNDNSYCSDKSNPLSSKITTASTCSNNDSI